MTVRERSSNPSIPFLRDTPLLNASQAYAQSQFETASIKLNKSGRPIVKFDIGPGGRLVATGTTMGLLVQLAYSVKEFQITKAPQWFDNERYDIDAIPGESTQASLAKLPTSEASKEVLRMLQSLLAERCQLVLKPETQNRLIYALVVAKSGPKLQLSTFKPTETLESSPSAGKDGNPPRGGIWVRGPGQLVSTGADMSNLASWLSRFVGRTVVDKTGISELFDFTLRWTPAEGESRGLPMSYYQDAIAPPSETSGPSIFSALKEQLGLKLEAQTAPDKILVIERVEKPSDN